MGSPSERGRRRSLSKDRAPARRRSRSPRGGERPDRERDNRGERRRRGSRERRRSPEKVEIKKEPVDEMVIKTEPGMGKFIISGFVILITLYTVYIYIYLYQVYKINN